MAYETEKGAAAFNQQPGECSHETEVVIAWRLKRSGGDERETDSGVAAPESTVADTVMKAEQEIATVEALET